MQDQCSVCKQIVRGSGVITEHLPWCTDKDDHAAGNHPIVLDPITGIRKPMPVVLGQVTEEVLPPLPIPADETGKCANCQGQNGKHYEWCPASTLETVPLPPSPPELPPSRAVQVPAAAGLSNRLETKELLETEPPSRKQNEERVAEALESIASLLERLVGYIEGELAKESQK